MESDHRYYARRAAEENLRARKAVTSAARERHLELASIFASKSGATIPAPAMAAVAA
jgi:hypothetical protein